MKVLTIKQPWATLIMQGDKRFEFRSWKTNYRGELLIHAGKGIDKEAMKRLSKYIPENLPSEKILGKVKLVDCIEMTEEFIEEIKKNKNEYITGIYAIGRYAWILKNIQVLDKPIKAKGHLGIWSLD